jgi:hypothetical protein
MADVNGYGTSALGDVAGGINVSNISMIVHPLSPAVTYEYQMECDDASNNNHTTWVNQGAPDYAATTAAATTAIANAALNTPVRNVRVVGIVVAQT